MLKLCNKEPWILERAAVAFLSFAAGLNSGLRPGPCCAFCTPPGPHLLASALHNVQRLPPKKEESTEGGNLPQRARLSAVQQTGLFAAHQLALQKRYDQAGQAHPARRALRSRPPAAAGPRPPTAANAAPISSASRFVVPKCLCAADKRSASGWAVMVSRRPA